MLFVRSSLVALAFGGPPEPPAVFTAILDLGVISVTVLLMGAVGMEIHGRHFAELARCRRHVALLLAVQVIVLPLLGFAVARALGLPPHLTAGILLVAACPVGDIVNFYALLARGNPALSLLLNALSCLGSPVTMMLTFAVYDRVARPDFGLSAPTPALVLRLLIMLLLPVAAGMAVRHFRPRLAEALRPALRNLSFVGVGLLIAYVLVIRRGQLAHDWAPATMACFAFIVPAFGAGLVTARLLRLGSADGFTAALVFAVRNVGLATAIAIGLLGRVEYAVFAAVYFLTEVPLLLGIVGLRRWFDRRTTGAASAPGFAVTAPNDLTP
jgi:BASS family bile acid:Na+ symporter